MNRCGALVTSAAMGARAVALPRALRARARRTVNRSVLQRLELIGSDGSDRPLEHAPLIIVGAPRSGSTLLYQLLVRRFDVTYLANRHCRYFGAPSLVERFGGRGASPSADFSSKHGLTAGSWGPSECGPFWYRFFHKSPQAVALADAQPDDLRRLRASFRALGDAGARPLVFKNLLCALRLEAIAHALPEARFVVISRDLEEHARSILTARQRANGEVDSWWSAEPSGWEQLRELEPAQQVLGQIDAIHATIDAARDQIGRDRFINVTYEDLIAETLRELGAISTFAAAHGSTLAVRGDVPASFPRQPAAALPGELDRELRTCLAARGRSVAPSDSERLETTL